ncbi:Ribosome-associated protein YbcJ, S4-like RNA binding protein [Pilibacter termitis]|uniref:Ribosome-associated protein YbcJ, S4-like RNA binding protein n=1 Tax=Pilibacter termitis TaxID=263852 RepID=A0A1T4Q3A3_9ENTE|nr:RNA-binding S4 domain-containing protein [Pilibacter termitis]SJZ98219.1 Ribosome-associated protein YbcJ, S4-like RNA binding protein [Pilibacter termitis]
MEYILYKEFLTLGQFLKEIGEIQTGGGAKIYLATQKVWLNQELENRRGKKLYPTDVVRLENGDVYEMRKPTSEELREREADLAEKKALEERVRKLNQAQKAKKKPNKRKKAPRFPGR